MSNNSDLLIQVRRWMTWELIVYQPFFLDQLLGVKASTDSLKRDLLTIRHGGN